MQINFWFIYKFWPSYLIPYRHKCTYSYICSDSQPHARTHISIFPIIIDEYLWTIEALHIEMQMLWNCITDIVCQALCLNQRLSLLQYTHKHTQHLKCKENKANIHKLSHTHARTHTLSNISITNIRHINSIYQSKYRRLSIRKRYSSHSIVRERVKSKRLRQTLCLFAQGSKEKRTEIESGEIRTHLECVRISLLRMECARTGSDTWRRTLKSFDGYDVRWGNAYPFDGTHRVVWWNRALGSTLYPLNEWITG